MLKQVYTAVTNYRTVVCNINFDGCPTNFTVCKIQGTNMISIRNLHTKLNLPGNVFATLNQSHMVNLVRSCFGKRKIIFDGEGGTINFRYFEMLVKLQEEEGMHLANKLRRTHVNF